MHVSNSTNLTYCAPCHAGDAAAANRAERCHGEGGGEEKHGGRMRGMGGAGGFAHLMSSVFQTLSQTIAAQSGTPAANATTPATPSTAATPAVPATGAATADAAADPAAATAQNQDLMQKVLSFMQTLFSAMAQMGGHGHGHHGHGRGHGHGHDCGDQPAISATTGAVPTGAAAATPAASETGATQPAPVSEAVNAPASPLRHYEDHGRRGGLVGKLQSLLQQIGSSGSAAASGPLAELNAAFQDLFSALQPAADATAAQPTLQGFLQKLVQNISGSGADTGAATGGLINTAA